MTKVKKKPNFKLIFGTVLFITLVLVHNLCGCKHDYGSRGFGRNHTKRLKAIIH